MPRATHLLTAVSTFTISGAVKTWTGAANNDWANAGNWSPSGAPGNFDTAIIPSVATQPTIQSAITTFISLTVDVGATVTINSTRTLTTTGAVIVNGTITN